MHGLRLVGKTMLIGIPPLPALVALPALTIRAPTNVINLEPKEYFTLQICIENIIFSGPETVEFHGPESRSRRGRCSPPEADQRAPAALGLPTRAAVKVTQTPLSIVCMENH